MRHHQADAAFQIGDGSAAQERCRFLGREPIDILDTSLWLHRFVLPAVAPNRQVFRMFPCSARRAPERRSHTERFCALPATDLFTAVIGSIRPSSWSAKYAMVGSKPSRSGTFGRQ